MLNSVSLEFYECLICSEIVLDNRECKSCHKLFCYDCIHKWLKGHNNCPHCSASPVQCNDKQDFSSFIHNYHAELIANSLEVECPNGADCDLKKIPRGDLKKHLDQFCTGRKCACKMGKFGCGWFGLSKLMDEHLSHDCIFANPMVVKALEDLETKVNSLTSENQKLKEENEKISKRVKELEEGGSIFGRNEPTAPSNDNNNSMVNQFNQNVPGYSTPSTPMPTPQPMTPTTFNQQPPPQMNQSMYGSSVQPLNQSMYTSYSMPYASTSLQSPTYGSVNVKRVRLVVTTCIWNRLPGIRGEAYLPLTDGYDNTFEFNVNEFNNGEISNYSPLVSTSGNWTSGAMKLNITWTQLNRSIIIDGMAGFCAPGATNLLLNFAVKSTGLGGRGNIGDGGKIHCTVIVN
ncbi:predicted protein [Naegleria gruberi]|uniref:Predicted protein n=1 Tax=Naegleria gruberi TaxID=5762 RepID=D2VQJ1_NAEGR|nr:uncharacterized protein NAEGRDRAFT_71243 [Naegleria gruberi]EFC40958.1 predicted protein [Naegleria gruberi]|eukprot:XP_002673702.1 predicted protein [Naegleria gruberi strain NEG-M]